MPVITPQQANGELVVHVPTQPDSVQRFTEPDRHDSDQIASADDDVLSSARRNGRRSWIVGGVVVAALAVGGTFAVTQLAESDDSAPIDAAAATPRRAVQAETRDLAEYEEVDGTIAFGDAVAVNAAVPGTVTATSSVDDVIVRGDVLFELDDQPVVALWGDLPLYRALKNGAEGDDVALLEANLDALGYDDDGDMIVDSSFDSDTAAAVEAWQADLGLEQTGVVELRHVRVLDGPAIVASVETPKGSTMRDGQPVVTLQVTDAIRTVGARADGEVTALPKVGTTFATGDIAYELDGIATPVIVGDQQFTRELALGVTDGDDVEALEAAMASLGFDDDGALVVDREFDESTENALRDWEDEVGIESDGVAQLGQFAVIEAGSRVTDTFLDRGDAVSAGSVLFETGISRRELTGTIDTADDRLVVEGAEVTVEFSDGATTTGTVRSVSSPIIQNGADGATSVTPFAITVGEIPEKFADRTSVPVTVSLVAELAQGAVVVPASALMSTGDGGYAVEAVTDTGTQMVAVDPGLFADGLVQVDGIAAGTAVVVPS